MKIRWEQRREAGSWDEVSSGEKAFPLSLILGDDRRDGPLAIIIGLRIQDLRDITPFKSKYLLYCICSYPAIPLAVLQGCHTQQCPVQWVSKPSFSVVPEQI